MPRNGSGEYSLPEPDFVNGTVIDETVMNSQLGDIESTLTGSVASNGETTMTGALKMGTNKITGLSAGAAATDSVTLGQVQAQAFIWCGTAGGTADALTLTPSPGISAYAAGQVFRFIAGGANNTGATTLSVSGLTTKAAQSNGAALGADAIEAGKSYEAVYDGTQFQIAKLALPTIPTGTKMLFLQASAPVGWTQDNTVNDRVLRIVDNTGTGAATGGSWTISGVTVNGHTLTAAESGLPSHNHAYNDTTGGNVVAGAGAQNIRVSLVGASTGNTGGFSASSAHNHGLSADGNWRPAYVDAIVCTKD